MAESIKQPADKIRKRSSPYPSFDLEQAINGIQMLKSNLGSGAYSSKSMAIALGYKGITGSSAMLISTCVQFGLLSKTGNAYSLSDLSQKILSPLSDDEKKGAILESLMSPSLYAKLFAAYSGQSLPNMLENILTRQYGIMDNAAKKAAETFKKSTEYAGVLKNGILSADFSDVDADTDISSSGSTSGTTDSNNSTIDTSIQAYNSSLFVDFTVPGTDVIIRFPNRYKDNLILGDFAGSIKELRNNIQSLDNKITKLDSNNEADEEKGDNM